MTQLEKKNVTAPEFSYIHSIRQREKKVKYVVLFTFFVAC